MRANQFAVRADNMHWNPVVRRLTAPVQPDWASQSVSPSELLLLLHKVALWNQCSFTLSLSWPRFRPPLTACSQNNQCTLLLAMQSVSDALMHPIFGGIHATTLQFRNHSDTIKLQDSPSIHSHILRHHHSLYQFPLSSIKCAVGFQRFRAAWWWWWWYYHQKILLSRFLRTMTKHFFRQFLYSSPPPLLLPAAPRFTAICMNFGF